MPMMHKAATWPLTMMYVYAWGDEGDSIDPVVSFLLLLPHAELCKSVSVACRCGAELSLADTQVSVASG